MKDIKSYLSKIAEEDMKDDTNPDTSLSIAIIVVCTLMVLYFVAHQMGATVFFTISFGILEMIMLYGSLIYWIFTCIVLVFGLKNLSRNIDSFGGLIFVVVGTAWLLVVFPFDFAYFADVLPDFLRFLVQWISNDIARVLMVLIIIVHLLLAVYSGILRVFVLKARADASKENKIV